MKTLTVKDIVELHNAGVDQLSYATIDVSQAYKVFRLVRDIAKAFRAFTDEQQEILRKAVSEEDYNKVKTYEEAVDRNAGGLVSREEYVRLAGLIRAKSAPMIEDALNEPSGIDARKVSFDTYFRLKQENAAVLLADGQKHNLLPANADIILEDFFWDSPEEKEDAPVDMEKKAEK